MSLAAHGPSPSSDGDLAPRAIREQLLPEDIGDFDREYRQAMADATETLDLNPVLAMLRRWRLVAWSSQDPAAHRRMLARAAALNAGEHLPSESWPSVKARLGLQVYSIDIDAEVSEQVEALPGTALSAFAELMVLLELAPWSGDPFNRKHPDRNMRTKTFGHDGAGLVIYLVIEDQQRVSLLRVIWAG